jgi:mono/diheme cytochrome c family protein
MSKLKLYTLSGVAAMVFALTSCNDKESPGWEYMPDMYRGPALNTYQAYDQFEDSLSARLPVEGTIPRGFMSYNKLPNTTEGYERSKTELQMPADFPTDSVTLADGGKLYGIYCAQCHGEKGDGNGILVQREKYLGVPAYNTREINMGSIFYVITNGKGVMGSHASQVTPDERWKIAQHVLKLRRALNGETSPAAATASATAETEAAAGEEQATETNEG